MKKKSAKKKSFKKAKKAVRKKPAKKAKPARKKPAKKPVVVKKPEKPIGRVTHYYTAIRVMIVKFGKPVKAGSSVRLKGATTDFVQKIDSMQFDHKPIRLAPKGKLVGIKAKKRVREGDSVYAT